MRVKETELMPVMIVNLDVAVKNLFPAIMNDAERLLLCE